MKKAVIDLGSNVAQLLIADNSSFKHYQRVTGLGENTKRTKLINPDAIERTLSALNDYKKIILAENILLSEVNLLATEACRIAENRNNLFEKISRLGFIPKLISADEEALYSSLGVVSDIAEDLSEYLVLDIGGASTEVTFVTKNPFKINKFHSFKIGTLEVSDWIKNNSLQNNLKSFLEQNTIELKSFKRPYMYCAMGAMTTIFNLVEANTSADEKTFHQHHIAYNNLWQKLQKLMLLNSQQLVEQFPYVMPRLATLPAALILANLFIEGISPAEVVLSNRGLVHGAILSKI